MELILLILKIILIAILVVLGLIVFLLGIVLLLPIRYEVSGSIGDSWEIKVRGKLTYLLSIFKLLFSYENGQMDMKIFLFGFEKKLQQEDGTDPAEDTEISGISEIVEGAEDVESAEVTLEEAPVVISEKEDAKEAVSIPEVIERQEKTSEENTGKISRKKKRKKEKKEKKESSLDFAFIKQQITDEHNKSVLRKIFSESGYLLKHFKFRKIVTDLIFSTGDPAMTGQAFGVLCMLPIMYRYNFKVTPDFESEEVYVKGTFLAAGKVRLIHIPIVAVRLILDKEVRLVVKRILTLLEK